MNNQLLRTIASIGLIVGAILGMAGTFVSSSSLRGISWGIDGIALIVASALLTIYHFRQGNDLVASGFLVFAVGEGLILSGSAMELEASIPSFGAGAGLWAAALVIISATKVFPYVLRGLGFIAAILFTIVAMQIFSGQLITPLSTPLPFYAYPFFAATLIGWAWVHLKKENVPLTVG